MRRKRSIDEEFADFVLARSPHLYRSAYLLTTSKPAAEDLVQGALTKAYANWSRISDADDPVAYVHRIVINQFLSDRRRRSNSELPVAEPPDSGAEHDPSTRIALIAALQELEKLDRAVVVFRYWEDRSVAETAAALGLSEPAVKSRSSRALRVLRRKLENAFQQPATPA